MCSDLLHFMGLSSKINELLLRWLLNHLPRGKPQRMTSTVLLKVYHEWGRESWLEVSTPGRPASPLDVSKWAQFSSAQLRYAFIHSFIQGTFIFYLLYAGGPEDTGMDKGWVLTSTVYTHTHSRVRPMPALEPMGHKHNPELEGRWRHSTVEDERTLDISQHRDYFSPGLSRLGWPLPFQSTRYIWHQGHPPAQHTASAFSLPLEYKLEDDRMEYKKDSEKDTGIL